MKTPLTIVILAAGLGTRMKSSRAKVLHRAGGLTLVEHVVETALELTTPERVFVVVGHQADDVRRTLAPYGVEFLHQTEQLGTGHAVLIGREALEPVGGRLVVLYGDCPLISAATVARLVDQQAAEAKRGAAATLITTVLDDPTGYGRIIFDGSRNVKRIIEQKSANEEQLSIKEINSGIYCFDAALFWEHAGKIRPSNPAKEYYLTDMAQILDEAGHAVRPMRIFDKGEVLGINTRIELAEVDAIFRARKTRELMLGGVTIEKPETVTIDKHVTVGAETIVGPFAQLLGTTAIGADCRVGACSIVDDSRVGDRVEIGAFTMIAQSTAADGARVGPYARVRPGSVIGNGAHVGNFVEVKNAQLGVGAKANHLAYIGDADVGAKTNIGAGTITCNYDGESKHRTTIGAEAFIGSNSTLVAPVEVGDGAYIGAGSVITAPVPEGALALGRARQVAIEGWVAKRKRRAAK